MAALNLKRTPPDEKSWKGWVGRQSKKFAEQREDQVMGQPTFFGMQNTFDPVLGNKPDIDLFKP